MGMAWVSPDCISRRKQAHMLRIDIRIPTPTRETLILAFTQSSNIDDDNDPPLKQDTTGCLRSHTVWFQEITPVQFRLGTIVVVEN